MYLEADTVLRFGLLVSMCIFQTTPVFCWDGGRGRFEAPLQREREEIETKAGRQQQEEEKVYN